MSMIKTNRVSLQIVVLALFLLGPVAARATLLRNGDFSESAVEAAASPRYWTVPVEHAGVVDCVATEGGDGALGRMLRAKIESVATAQGQVLQKVSVRPGRRLRITADVRSSVPGAGFIQVKLYKNRKELSRLSLPPSPIEWKTIQMDINSADADSAEVLCRWKREKKYVGATAEFRNVKLEDLGEKVNVPMTVEKLECVATLNAIGVTATISGDWNKSATGQIRYRATSESTWQTAMAPVDRPSEQEFRGSVLTLPPETEYEVEFALLPDGKPVLARVSTWKEEPTVGRVVELPDMKDRVEPYRVSLKGMPDAWIRIRPAPLAKGVISSVDGGPDFAVQFNDAAYVIFEGFTIRGGKDDAVRINDSHDVMIRGCDIAGWGQIGAPNEKGVATNAAGKAINMQSGISVHTGSERIRLERNFIHSPRGSANSWRYGHPHGPTGVSQSNPLGNIVIRDNDIVGNEDHWFNDGIEGEYNSYVTGGPNRDSDVLGNVVAFANDDGIELDGGQRNVRCFNNLFRWTYCGVSCAPNLRGPSYVYRNLIVLGEERGRANFGFKMGGAQFPNQGLSRLFRNTVISHGATLSAGHYGKGPSPIESKDNVYHLGAVSYGFVGGTVFNGDLVPPNGFPEALRAAQGDTPPSTPVFGTAKFVEETHGDYRIASAPVDHEVGVFDRGADGQFPIRAGRVRTTPALLTLGVAHAGEVSVEYAGVAGLSWTATPNSPWLSCSPASGGICGTGTLVKARIAIDATKTLPGIHRGAVTFRTDRGFLKTVFITATVLPAKPWGRVFEAEALAHSGFAVGRSASADGGAYLVATNGTPHQTASVKLDVEVPADGDYQIWAQTLSEGPVTAMHDSFFVRVDGAEPRRWDLAWRSPAFWIWQAAGVWDGKDMTQVRLSKGRHMIEILSREPGARLDAIYLGNHPVPEDAPVLDDGIAATGGIK